MGIDGEKLRGGFSTFKGVKRRQEVRGERRGVTVIDDFAHHPTAVRETIDAVRGAYAGRRLWAIFEPRSNTSKRNIFSKRIRRGVGAGRRYHRCRRLSARASAGKSTLIGARLGRRN